MHSSRLEALMILVSAHILVKAFDSNLSIPSSLLHNSYGKEREHKDYEYTQPCLLGAQLNPVEKTGL